MHVKTVTGTRAYARGTIGGVISRAKDTHTPNRVIRLGDEWDELGDAAGRNKRASVIKQLVQWYLRYPGARLPERPPRPPGG
jgi:hypothetical protein